MGKMSPPHIRRRAAAQNDGGGVFPVAGADGTSGRIPVEAAMRAKIIWCKP
jgi:hypothetical protein